MRSIIRVLAGIGGVGLTIYAGKLLYMGFGNGYSFTQGPGLTWLMYAVGAWCIFWWAGQGPK